MYTHCNTFKKSSPKKNNEKKSTPNILVEIHANPDECVISQQTHSIRPLLMPSRSLVRCSRIYRSQASTLLFLQHSLLISFLCFSCSLSLYPSLPIPLFSCDYTRKHPEKENQVTELRERGLLEKKPSCMKGAVL